MKYVYTANQKQKYKDMNQMNYSPEEAFKVIKNAYDETTSEKFENNLVESVCPEVRQVIITVKPFFTFDKEAVKVLLQNEFPKNNYMVSMFDDRIVITKTN